MLVSMITSLYTLARLSESPYTEAVQWLGMGEQRSVDWESTTLGSFSKEMIWRHDHCETYDKIHISGKT